MGPVITSIVTSLPELASSISAALAGSAGLVIGNVVGSNIANTLLTLGVSAAIRPLAVSELSVVYTIPIMMFFSLGLVFAVRSDWRISRAEGVTLALAYAAFMATAFVVGWE